MNLTEKQQNTGKRMDEYRKFIAVSRYAKWKPEENRRETWEETVDRFMEAIRDKVGESYDEVREAILNQEVMPSMRGLMTAGAALDRDPMSLYNCSYMAIDNVRCFDEALYILMVGTGLGFSVERQYVNKLPEVATELYHTDTTIVVADSKLGWAKAYKELISLLYSGHIPKWDLSKLRPAGARLKTFGGRASGPAPLDSLFKFTVETFQRANGRKLQSIECHDLMCKVGEIVVVGGVRRSALISLSNLTDERMRNAKSGQWWEQNAQRALANNSVAYTEKPDIGIFMKEWHSLYESKSGERGIFNRRAAELLVPDRRKEANGDYKDYGTNPCCFSGEMKLLTAGGYKTFEELEGKTVNIINNDGVKSEGSVWCSGIKPVVELRFRNRDSIICTDDHIFMTNEGKECKAEDLKGKRVMPFVNIKTTFSYREFLAGFIQGDGNTGRLNDNTHKGLEVYLGEKDKDVADFIGTTIGTWYSSEAYDIAVSFGLSSKSLPLRDLPHFLFGPNLNGTNADFLAGLYSANGCVVKGHRVAFKTTNRVLATGLQEILLTLGIESYITTNKVKAITFKNGDYTCKESYDVNISRLDSLIKFAEKISFIHKYKQKDLLSLIKAKAWIVSKVTKLSPRKIYDFTEPMNHWGVVEGVVVHNSEIVLKQNGLCNLSEVVIRSTDTMKDLHRKVRIATIIGTIQATYSDFKYVRPIWKKNVEEEALLGVSLTGIMDCALTDGSDGPGLLSDNLDKLKTAAVQVNVEWSQKLGINPALAISCIKPSGTVSQLVDSASGIHARHSKFYIRTVRADNKDPLALFMKDKGFPCEPDVMKPDNGLVFSFPIKSPEGCVTRNDRTAIEQLELWKTYQLAWCEHKPSVTISVREEEWFEVGAWCYKNFDILSGVSFLPHSDHSYQQAPYQECNQEEYENFLKDMPKNVDWTELSNYEAEDNTTGTQSLACTSGVCEVVDI